MPDNALDVEKVPCFRFLRAQGAIVESRRPPVMPELSAAAMRHASELGTELRQLSLDRNRSGATVVTAPGLCAGLASPQLAADHRQDRPGPGGPDRPRDGPDHARWPTRGIASAQPVPWPEVQGDAGLLAPYFEGFARFYGDAAGVSRSYWALACWLYAAPFAPLLRSAALRHDGSPLAYPVQAVLYGRSDGGKTMFSRVISRSMFGIEQMIRGQHFTTARALGLREQLGAIPLLIDDVNRDRFTQYVPDLVKFDHESGEGYAPILISTNRDVTAVTPDLRKRMIVCHIDGARPRSMPEAPARAALSRIGTALYRTYLDRLAPRMPGSDRGACHAIRTIRPDLLRLSSETLGDLLGEALDGLPPWATPIGLDELDRLKEKPLLDLLGELVEQDSERVSDQPQRRRAGRRLRRRSPSGGALREAGARRRRSRVASRMRSSSTSPRWQRNMASTSRRGGRARGSRACWDVDPRHATFGLAAGPISAPASAGRSRGHAARSLRGKRSRAGSPTTGVPTTGAARGEAAARRPRRRRPDRRAPPGRCCRRSGLGPGGGPARLGHGGLRLGGTLSAVRRVRPGARGPGAGRGARSHGHDRRRGGGEGGGRHHRQGRRAGTRADGCGRGRRAASDQSCRPRSCWGSCITRIQAYVRMPAVASGCGRWRFRPFSISGTIPRAR